MKKNKTNKYEEPIIIETDFDETLEALLNVKPTKKKEK